MPEPLMEQRLAMAETVCAQRGVRLTPLRRRVLEHILRTPGVIKAYDLLHDLGLQDRDMKPPSIYRSLAFLLEQGFIHRIESLNGFVICDHPGEWHQTLLMICDACGHVQEAPCAIIHESLQAAATEKGFSIAETVLELHGHCQSCTPPVADTCPPTPTVRTPSSARTV